MPERDDKKSGVRIDRNTRLQSLIALRAKGMRAAIKAKELAEEFGVGVSSIQGSLEDLRRGGACIMGSRAHGGVFVPETIEEAATVFLEEMNAARTHLINVCILRRNIEQHFGTSLRPYLTKPDPRQLNLDLDLLAVGEEIIRRQKGVDGDA